MAQFQGKGRHPVPSIPRSDPHGRPPSRELAFSHYDVGWQEFGTYGPGSGCSREELDGVFHWHSCPLSRINALRSLLLEVPHDETQSILSRALEDPNWDMVYIALDWIRSRESGTRRWIEPASRCLRRALADDFDKDAQSRIVLLALDVMRVSGEPLAARFSALVIDEREHIRTASWHALESAKSEGPKVLEDIHAVLSASDESSPRFSRALEAMGRACRSPTEKFRREAYVRLACEPRAAARLAGELVEGLKEMSSEARSLARAALQNAGRTAAPILEESLACYSVWNSPVLASQWHRSHAAIGAPVRALQRAYRQQIRWVLEAIEGRPPLLLRAKRELKAFIVGISSDLKQRVCALALRL